MIFHYAICLVCTVRARRRARFLDFLQIGSLKAFLREGFEEWKTQAEQLSCLALQFAHQIRPNQLYAALAILLFTILFPFFSTLNLAHCFTLFNRKISYYLEFLFSAPLYCSSFVQTHKISNHYASWAQWEWQGCSFLSGNHCHFLVRFLGLLCILFTAFGKLPCRIWWFWTLFLLRIRSNKIAEIKQLETQNLRWFALNVRAKSSFSRCSNSLAWKFWLKKKITHVSNFAFFVTSLKTLKTGITSVQYSNN